MFLYLQQENAIMKENYNGLLKIVEEILTAIQLKKLESVKHSIGPTPLLSLHFKQEIEEIKCIDGLFLDLN